jgi:hypothetical protein
MRTLLRWCNGSPSPTSAAADGRRRSLFRRHAMRSRPLLQALEDRCLLSGSAGSTTASPASSDVRLIDGTGNNLVHLNRGSAGVDLHRVAAAAYADGVSTPGGASRPGARIVSNTIASTHQTASAWAGSGSGSRRARADFEARYVPGHRLDPG